MKLKRLLSARALVTVFAAMSIWVAIRLTRQIDMANPQSTDDVTDDRRLEIARMLQTKTNLSSLCSRVINGDNQTIAACASDGNSTEQSAADYLKLDCEQIRSQYVVHSNWLPPEELQTSIAFTVLLKDNVHQFERLLRAIYRPHNFYCAHVDGKSTSEIQAAVRRVASCFDNVMVPEQLVSVDHGGITQLDAELTCMSQLLKASGNWTWFINLTGQEFPLQTMWQLVRILKLLSGTNSIHSCPKWEFADRKASMRNAAERFGLVPTVGSTHIVAVRSFVEFAASKNPTTVALHDALQSSPSPDECFFNTLNYSPSLQLLGGATAPPRETGTFKFINRVKKWQGLREFPCESGHYVRDVCIFGVADLPFLTNVQRRQLFVNKLYWNFQHFALDCLETWLWNLTLLQYSDFWKSRLVPTIDSDFYLLYKQQFHKTV